MAGSDEDTKTEAAPGRAEEDSFADELKVTLDTSSSPAPLTVSPCGTF